MRTRLHRPSPAMIIALIALFVAMGGTGYAAATGSIDGREIKNSSVQGKDIKNSSVTGSDVKNNSLTGSDVSESSLGKIPSAAKADSASTATSASSIGNNTVSSSKVVDGSLDDTDIGDVVLRNVTFTIGNIAANSCTNNTETIGGGDLRDAQILVTSDFTTGNTSMVYDGQNGLQGGQFNLHVCNPTNLAINDGDTTFAILVIR